MSKTVEMPGLQPGIVVLDCGDGRRLLMASYGMGAVRVDGGGVLWCVCWDRVCYTMGQGCTFTKLEYLLASTE